ncbi:MAG TPA: histidine kinase, partial [Pseudoneobacillus sp.]|nr:histidine kinase [Pseudoneobacillus sp.]
MPNTEKWQKKERRARICLLILSVIGWVAIFQFGFLQLHVIKYLAIFILLVLFLAVVENFPMPVWRGFTTISFPIIYAIVVMQGIEYAVSAYAIVVFLGYLLKRRPLRIVFFNPAQLSLSLLIAFWCTNSFFSLFITDETSRMAIGILHFSFMIFPFYLVNNLVVDFILFVRPQPYTLASWKQKTFQELNSLVVSYIYLVLFIVLGNQNRGEIDVISFFFFFSPLVGLALL